MDIVIQGKIFPGKYETAKCYTTLDFIEKVIISTWDNETLQSDDSLAFDCIFFVSWV